MRCRKYPCCPGQPDSLNSAVARGHTCCGRVLCFWPLTLCTRAPSRLGDGPWPSTVASTVLTRPPSWGRRLRPAGGHHLLQELLKCGQVPAAVAQQLPGSTDQPGPGPAPSAQGQVLQGCSQVLPGPRAPILTGATVHQETGQPTVLPGSGVLDDPGPPCHHLQLPTGPGQLPGTPPLPPLHLLQQGPGQSIFSPG